MVAVDLHREPGVAPGWQPSLSGRERSIQGREIEGVSCRLHVRPLDHCLAATQVWELHDRRHRLIPHAEDAAILLAVADCGRKEDKRSANNGNAV